MGEHMTRKEQTETAKVGSSWKLALAAASEND
jgi:hypothetical protein